jgi:methylglutaconyl-CoA hydratase
MIYWEMQMPDGADSIGDAVLLMDCSNPLIAIYTLNRPQKRNALNIELIEQMAVAVERLASDVGRRVLIVRGNGPVFCAGLDLREAMEESNSERSARSLARLYLGIANLPLITISSAQGGAFGGGVGILAACDLCIAADDLRVGFPEVHRGLVAGLVTALLRRQMGDKDLRQAVLLGQTLNAIDAQRLGIVQKVVPIDQLPAATSHLADIACQGAPGAIKRTKRLLEDLAPRALHADMERAMLDHLTARNSAEAKEGIAAFLARRSPNWPSHR